VEPALLLALSAKGGRVPNVVSRNDDFPEIELFAPIAKRPLPRAAMGFSICIHIVFALLLAWLPLSATLQEPERIVFLAPQLITPSVAPVAPSISAPRISRPPERQPVAPKRETAAKPLIQPEKARTPAPSRPALPQTQRAEERAERTVEPKELARAVTPAAPRTGVFPGSSTPPAPQGAPPRPVQVGGFGVPARNTSAQGSPDFVTRVGSFGPAAIGKGADTAGGPSRGVATGGFGTSAAGSGTDSRAPGISGEVRKGGFGDLGGAAQTAAARAAAPPVGPAEGKPSPVEITFKPRPDYTDEARSLGLEGDVVLEVLFAASGRLRVIQVVRGLGHGLDEAAMRAAEQIRFKPAQRDGKPVDAKTTIRIVFRLA
jgi:TonB family protein